MRTRISVTTSRRTITIPTHQPPGRHFPLSNLCIAANLASNRDAVCRLTSRTSDTYVWFVDQATGDEVAVVMLVGDKATSGNDWYPAVVNKIDNTRPQ